MNLFDPEIYSDYTLPTNDIDELLEAVARKTGRLQKGGIPDVEAAALWVVQRWRGGHLGRFVLDTIDQASLQRGSGHTNNIDISLNQARIANRNLRKQRSRQRQIDSS